jgi:hypothetical protein
VQPTVKDIDIVIALTRTVWEGCLVLLPILVTSYVAIAKTDEERIQVLCPIVCILRIKCRI